MRSRAVTINGVNVTLNEYKIKTIKNDVIPKLEPALKAVAAGDTSELIDNFGKQLKEVFPELKDVDFDECYPSEIEEFVEAWIDINFTGLKRVAGPLLSLVKMGQQLQGSVLAKPSGNLTTGKN